VIVISGEDLLISGSRYNIKSSSAGVRNFRLMYWIIQLGITERSDEFLED
jgi:hypothetical protein